MAVIYVETVRGTPALVQLFLVYFGLLAIGVKFSAFQAAVIGLGLNVAAYISEVLRAGIEAVDAGQREASLAVGMTPVQSLRFIVLPQAIRIVLPPLASLGIALLKHTSIAALISVPDLTLRARNLASEYFLPLQLFVTIGIMYFLMCFPLSMFVRLIERRWLPRSR